MSLKRLSYIPERGVAVYRTDGGGTGKLGRIELRAVEFLRRFALLAPPPRKNTVRYYGALAPNSPLRPLLVQEAGKRSGDDDRAFRMPALKAANAFSRAKEELRSRAKSWAACLNRIFEIEPLICPRCAGDLIPAAAIIADRELLRLLAHLKLPTEFPWAGGGGACRVS